MQKSKATYKELLKKAREDRYRCILHKPLMIVIPENGCTMYCTVHTEGHFVTPADQASWGQPIGE